MGITSLDAVAFSSQVMAHSHLLTVVDILGNAGYGGSNYWISDLGIKLMGSWVKNVSAVKFLSQCTHFSMALKGISQMLVFLLVVTWAVSTRLESQGVLSQNFWGIWESVWLNPGSSHRYIVLWVYQSFICIIELVSRKYRMYNILCSSLLGWFSQNFFQVAISAGFLRARNLLRYSTTSQPTKPVNFSVPLSGQNKIFSGSIYEHGIDENSYLSQCTKHNLIKYWTMTSGSTSVVILTEELFIFRWIIAVPSPWTWAASISRITHKILPISLKTLNRIFLLVAFLMALKKPSHTYSKDSLVAQLQYTHATVTPNMNRSQKTTMLHGKHHHDQAQVHFWNLARLQLPTHWGPHWSA